MNYNKKSIEDIDVAGKRVLCRCDFNVPTKNGVITSDKRIVAAMPTIKYLVDHNAKVILCSHMGKPKGEWKPELSLKIVAKRISELLGKEVIMAADVAGPDAKAKAAALKDGDVMLLENTRFEKGETKNDPELSKALASLADVFVNDAFGTAHRAHSSTAGVADYLPAVSGFLVQKEVSIMGKALSDPERPFVAVLGGAKVSDKLNVINNLLEKVDTLIIGGGMAYTFLAAKGYAVGKSLLDESKIDYCKDMMAKAEAKGVKLLLPVDVVVADSFPDPIDAEIETEVVIEGDYEANSFDMALEYDASDIEVLEITPGQVIQEIVENGGEFDLQQGSGTGSGGSGSPDASTGTIDAKAESGGMAFGGNGQIMKMKVKIPEDAEAGEKNMDMTVNDLSKNNSDGTTEQVPHYDVTGNSATGSIGGGGSGGSGGGGASGGASGGKLVKTDTIFKNYESDIKNLKQLGKYISDALSKAMESINWDKIYSKARNFGKGLADFLNGLINPRLFGNVGKTIAGALNTAIYATLSFGQTFDWSNLGKSLAEGINKFFQTFDFKALAEDINVWVQGVYKTIKTMIENIKWSDVWKGVKDFLSNIDIETVEILLGAFALKLAGKLLTGKLLKETIGKLIGAKFTAAFGSTAVKSLLSYAIPISLAVVVATLSFTVGKDSIKKDANNLEKAYEKGGFLQYLQESFKQLLNPFEWINAYGGGVLSHDTVMDKLGIGNGMNVDEFVKNLPKKEDYKSLDDFQKALNEFNDNMPNKLNVPDSFDLKAWIDEWKNINGLDDVDLRADVVLPNLQEKISEFKDNVKEWWGLNVELPVRNKLTTTLEDVSSWWEDVKEYWGEKKLSIQTEIGEIKGKIEEKWNEALTYIQENIFPWFTKKKWMEVGNGIKEGLSAKWDEFSDWWQNTGIYNWWENHVKPWFTKKRWDEQGDGMKKGLSEKWGEFSNWWSTSGIGSWWTNHVEPYFTKDNWTFSGISDGLKQAFDNAVAGIKQVWNNFATWLNSKLSFSWDSVNIGGKEIIQAGNINLGKIPTFATGGFPEDGLFFANHGEMVGQFSNGNTAVANNSQIVEGIKAGVKSAVSEALTPYLSQIAQNTSENSGIKVELDGKVIYDSTVKQWKSEARRTQRNPVPIF